MKSTQGMPSEAIPLAAPADLLLRPAGSALSPWVWFPLGVLLLFGISYRDDTGDWPSIEFSFQVFFPLFTAWMAHRYGPKAIGSLLLVALVPLLIKVQLQVSDSTRLLFGLYMDTFALAVCTAIAISRPQWTARLAGVIRPWWRRSIWLALISVSICAIVPWYRVFDSLADSGKKVLTFHAFENFGTVLAVLSCGLAVRWRQALARCRSLWWAKRSRARKTLAVALAAASASALVIELKFDAGWFTLHFGLAYTDWAVLGVFCFVLTASRVVDWRLLCCFLVALFFCWTLWFDRPASPAELLGLRWTILISDGMSGALLGILFSVLRRDQGFRRLKSVWIPVVLAAVVFFQFAGDGFREGGFLNYWYLGAAAFLTGLIWRGRGLVLGPLLIQLCCALSLSSVAAFGEPPSFGRSVMALLGAITFSFAFFGLLSNRYDRLRERADSIRGLAITNRSQSVWTSIDITALGKVVRQFDISATIKAFSAVLAPLIATLNAAAAVAMLTKVVQLSSESEFTGAARAVAVVGVLTPFLFMITDWAARKDDLKHLSAMTGAAVGGLGFAALGAFIGFFMDELEDPKACLIVAALLVLALGMLLIARTGRMRVVGWITAAVVLSPLTFQLGKALIDDAQSEEGGAPLAVIVLLVLLTFAIWWLVRAVRLRIVLSADWPRSLLLGPIRRRGFWVRAAFLIGLPSSLWSFAAFRTTAFW